MDPNEPRTGLPPDRVPGAPDAVPPPPWLQDVDRAAQHLARLSLETDAQAALITRGPRLWAYAGELSRPELDELARSVASGLEGVEAGDLARFVRLGENGGEYMLYSTTLVDGLVLSLAFDSATRFSEIRSQAFKLSRALATIPNGEAQGGDLQNIDPALPPESEAAPPPSVEALVSDTADWRPEGSQTVSAGQGEGDFPEEGDADSERPLEGYMPADSQPSAETLFLDPVSPAIHNISFACVLIPRIPLHRLLGDLKEALELWMPQICLGYGWRLGDLAVHPDRILWVVNLPPDYSASFMLDTIRRLTSEKIFERNPVMKAENPSGDFWAPGYMILAASRLPGDEPVAKYVRRTRSWQGYR